MCMVTSGTSICHARRTTSDTRVGNTFDARVCWYVFMCMSEEKFLVSRYLYDLAISGQYHKVPYMFAFL